MLPSNGLGVKQKYMQFLVVLLVVVWWRKKPKKAFFVCVCFDDSRELFRCASYIFFTITTTKKYREVEFYLIVV